METEKRNEELANPVRCLSFSSLRVTAKATSVTRNQSEASQDPASMVEVPVESELSRRIQEATLEVLHSTAQRVVNQYLAVRQLVLDNTRCF